jgi:hypothetical protein
LLKGSQSEGSDTNRSVIVPPYCGVPSLSHQLPVAAVVDVVEIVVFGVLVGVLVEIAVGVLDAAIEVVVDCRIVAEVDVEQDAKTSDITMRQINNIQIVPLFILTSLFNIFFLVITGISCQQSP